MKKEENSKETIPIEELLKIPYYKETEAAWYALKNFINPLDCSEKVDGQVYPMNNNAKLACVFSGYKYWLEKEDPYRPSYISKKKLYEHLKREKTFYYRSKYNGIHSIGYGSSDQQAQKLIFSNDLDITHKVKRYEHKYILLLGIDLDCHHGEKDVQGVQQWLINDYFPISYWEPSTGLKGRHGYVKIAYDRQYSISYINSCITNLFKLLDMKRELLGFKANIDKPCGLPSLVTLSNINEYADHPVNKINDKYILYKREQCLKIPRFNNNLVCSMDDIVSFYNTKFYSFENIKSLYQNLGKELKCKENEFIIKDEEELLTIVRPPQEDESLKDAAEAEITVNLSDYWSSKKKGNTSEPVIYQKRIEKCKTIQDTLEKTRRFYWYYSLYKKEVPTVDDAVNEYIKQGLNTNSDISTKKRYDRFVSCRKFMVERFDLSKTGFNLDDWYQKKENYICQISDLVKTEELYWNKSKKKNYKLRIEELALIYFAIKKSGEFDRNNTDKIIKNSFSYNMIKKFFKVTFAKSCHRSKSAMILKILKNKGLIFKIGNYIPGVRGNCYVTADIFQLFDDTVDLCDWGDMSTDDFIKSLCD